MQAGGDATITGSFSNPTASIINITGAGSTFSTSAGATFSGGSVVNVSSTGQLITGALATVAAPSQIAIAGGTLLSNGDFTLEGGQLTRDAAGAFTLAAGRTLAVQSGGDAIFAGSYIVPSATIAVTGAGSTLSTTSTLSLGNGSSTTVSAGGSIQTGLGFTDIGTFGGNGTVIVDGNGSSLTSSGVRIGENGFTGSLTFSNGSTGAFGALFVDASSAVAGTSGLLNIRTGASVTATGLLIATDAAATSGAVGIDGAGSGLTVTGLLTTIGADSASSGTLLVQNGGTFTTGTGLTTVNATGVLNVNAGGTMIVRGPMVVHSSLNIGGTVIISESAMLASELSEGGLSAPDELDFGAWENSGPSGGAHAATVPEPMSAALLALGALSLLARRRRS